MTRKLALLAASASAITPAVFAGGIQLYEIATPDVGLGSAGYAARAQDASTVFKNPAGMSLLPGSQFQGGLQLTYGSVNFSKDASTSPWLGDNNGGNAIGALPAAACFSANSYRIGSPSASGLFPISAWRRSSMTTGWDATTLRRVSCSA